MSFDLQIQRLALRIASWLVVRWLDDRHLCVSGGGAAAASNHLPTFPGGVSVSSVTLH